MSRATECLQGRACAKGCDGTGRKPSFMGAITQWDLFGLWWSQLLRREAIRCPILVMDRFMTCLPLIHMYCLQIETTGKCFGVFEPFPGIWRNLRSFFVVQPHKLCHYAYLTGGSVPPFLPSGTTLVLPANKAMPPRLFSFHERPEFVWEIFERYLLLLFVSAS